MPGDRFRNALLSGVRFSRETDGGAAIVLAALAPVLIFGLALGAEASAWEQTRRRLQNAADVSAYAAATQVRAGYDISVVKSAAKVVAVDSGFKGVDEGIVVAAPPTDAPMVRDPLNAGAMIDPNGRNDFVHVVLTQNVTRRFSGFFARGEDGTRGGAGSTFPISTEAVAGIVNGRPACVLALSGTASGAVTVSGNTNVGLAGCDVASNSLSSSSITTQGNSAQLAAECVSTVGGVSWHNSSNVDLECSSAIVNGGRTADPYASRPAPDYSALACSNNNVWTSNNGQPRTGRRYCGGANVNNTVTVNKQAGSDWIVLDGGTWRFNASSNFTALGVTLYLTNGATLAINGNATYRHTAPLTGDYAGLAIYYDRTNVGSSTLNGGAGFSIVGAVYGAKHDLQLSGNISGSGPGECTQIITNTVEFTGSANFDTDCSASGTTAIMTGSSIQIVG